MLDYISNFLEDKQLLVIERVSKKWQICVLKLLSLKKVLRRLDHYSHTFKDKSSYSMIIT